VSATNRVFTDEMLAGVVVTLTLEAAQRAADALLEALSPACERIVIAGSIRREKPDGIKDIELVAIPRTETATNLFGEPDPHVTRSLLDARIEEINHDVARRGVLAPRAMSDDSFRMGPRYKALQWLYDGVLVPVDLFVVLPPAEWGAILAIRTGPAAFSQHLVTNAKRLGRHVASGRVLTRDDEVIPVPTERDFFEACGVEWLEPRDRR
jgi:DNA polymerase/3'-5' exonuclease PolX